MGSIRGIKTTKEDRVIVEVQMSYQESLKLKGHIKHVHLFSEDSAEIKANLSQRGANEATKYFLIPRELRQNLNFNEQVMCQRIDSEDRIIFVYMVEKTGIPNVD